MTDMELVTFYRKKKPERRPRKHYVYDKTKEFAARLGEIGIKDLMQFRNCSWRGASRHIAKALKAGYLQRVSRGRYKAVV